MQTRANKSVVPTGASKRDVVTYPHEVLWRAAKSSLRTARIESDSIRDDHLSILALVSGFLAFEGFVNLVGEEVAPDVWKKEREFFSRGKYRGIKGKVAYLYDQFPGVALDEQSEPYLTFAKVKSIRDGIAHGRPERYEETSEAEFPEYRTAWGAFEDPNRVEDALESLRELAEQIRNGALSILKEEYRLSHLHYPAFGGPSLSSEGEGE